MKKSIKILTLVLALALICGALVVSAFATEEAAVTGVTQSILIDFQDSPTEEASYLDGVAQSDISTVPTSQGAVPKIVWKETGKIKMTTSEYDTENKYMLWTTTVGGSTTYIDCYLHSKPSASGEVLNMTGKAGTDVKYIVMDVDLMLPTEGVAPKNANIQFLRRTVADGATANSFVDNATKYTGTGLPTSVLNIQADGKINCYNSAGAWVANGKIVLGTSWTHITVVLENEILQDGDGVNYVRTTEYLYANGALVDSFVWFDNSACPDASVYWNSDKTNFNYCDVRVNVAGNDTEAQLAIDNFNVRMLSNEYNGNLKTVLTDGTSITLADVNVYDPENMPFGTLAATNETQGTYYDSFNKAVAAAADDDVLLLNADLTKDVTLDKYLEIYPGEYSVGDHLKVAEGWQVEYDDVALCYFTSEITDPYTVTWGACNCGLAECDATHPGNATSELGIGANIYDAYEQAVENGYAWGVTVDGRYYYLAGWTNADTSEELAADAVVTDEMLGTSVTYNPIIKSKLPLYSYVDATGNAAIGFDDNTLSEIVELAKPNSTITLLADVVIPDTAPISISKNLTIDLNGHVLSDVKVTAKYATFSPGANFTIKGDVEGSTVVKAHNTSGTNYQGVFIQPSSSSAVINFEGENLAVFVPCLVASWGTTINLNIDGGYYAKGNSSDNGGYMYANASAKTNVSLKNATFGDIHGFDIYYTNTVPHTFTADNCIFLDYVINVFVPGLTDATITNCYIASTAKFKYEASWKNNGSPADLGGSAYLGAGNWISADAEISLLKYSENIDAYDAANSIVVPVQKITFSTTNGVVSYAIATTETTYTFQKYTADSSKLANVTWYDTDGTTVLGTTVGIPGLNASAPGVPVADGWVNAHYTDWTNANGEKTTLVPTDATEVAFTLVAGSAADYTVGKVPLWMNWAYLSHSSINVYVPANAPAGVTLTDASLNGTNRWANLNANTGYTVADTAVNCMSVWPQIHQVDNGISVSVTFTYEGKTLTYAITANVANYVQRVLENNHSQAQKEAIAAWAGYVIAANNAAGETTTDAFLAVYNGIAQEYLPEARELGVTAAPDVSALSTYIESVTGAVGADSLGSFVFKITPKAALTEAGYTITCSVATPAKKSDGNYYIQNANAHYLDNEFTIKVMNGEEVVAQANYSLAGYLYSIQGQTGTTLTELAEAAWLYFGAVSAIKNY
ncbi:MAG: hypothetical protein IJ515_05750 [Clostridia bacterium]|nr:hypothetical protein [Clostridia bacterium]